MRENLIFQWEDDLADYENGDKKKTNDLRRLALDLNIHDAKMCKLHRLEVYKKMCKEKIKEEEVFYGI